MHSNAAAPLSQVDSQPSPTPSPTPSFYDKTSYFGASSPPLSSSAASLSTEPAQRTRPSSFPLPTDGGVLDADWLGPARLLSQSAPLLRVQPSPSTNMSAVAIQYDPGFSMGTKSSYPWSVNEPLSDLLGHDLGHYTSDASLTSHSRSRSGTSSPPRSSAEMRELRRQRDQARRDTKLQARAHRAGSVSGSSGVYSPPPTTLADLAAAITTGAGAGLSLYATVGSAVSQMALLSDGPVTPEDGGGVVAYGMPPQSYSPPLPQDQNAMFPSPYAPPQSYLEYPAYTTTAPPSMSSPYEYVYPVGPSPTHMLNEHAHAHHHHAHAHAHAHHAHPAPHDAAAAAAGQVRVVQNRPKPQCWEHGCNGRQFSTFSNLLRHQREKSGQAAKAVCPNCGAEFTRTTARNGHLLHDKCKSKREGSK
ncbi:hypothetical protein P8C59_005661 [Phyllachora maydis]|uniref:Uncharacterized protein n=1 Tax=Phyllachora maydis TaxID=1825666 RepID=A0AAD9MFQ3_9PEZI|nr:hypothetical protein P8C59_005661 [Phyllachora maydis]